MAVIKIPTLINKEYFQAYSPYPKNMQLDEIEPYFPIAESIWVKPVIGDALYSELLSQVMKNEVTELNSTLLIALYPYEAFAIAYEALPFAAYHISEVGITCGKSDNSDSVPVSGLNLMQTRLRSTLESLKIGLKKWLDSNADKYPLYRPLNCACDSQSTCENSWVEDYYTGGFNKRSYMANVRKLYPNPRLQAYPTPRKNIDIG